MKLKGTATKSDIDTMRSILANETDMPLEEQVSVIKPINSHFSSNFLMVETDSVFVRSDSY